MKLKEPLRYLKQVGTGHVYIWTEILASRTDMVEFVPEPKPEPKPEPIAVKAEAKPEPKGEAKPITPFKIEKAKKANAGE